MSDIAIAIENISKQYRLGTIGTQSIQGDLKRWWAQVTGKEDPFAKIGQTNNLSTINDSEYVWALKDITLDIHTGDVLGIIGKNGAGKSTLLKILSRVTTPTIGQIKIHGRIASLLEVGTGFHPELTGRENIFLNGAILGMTRPEIRSKFDEIVDFSGVEKYIDTPVKRYSSGMYVRLAFAVAAHLEPEILVVDEVLAVGDVDFQKKALGKMNDISKGQGRTVLFVSHNMAAIQSLCSKVVLMEQGMMKKYGNTDEIINQYLTKNAIHKTTQIWSENEMPGNEYIMIRSVLVKSTGIEKEIFDVTTPIQIEIEFKCLMPQLDINLSIVLNNLKGEAIFNDISESKFTDQHWQRVIMYIPANLLNDDVYTLNVLFVKDNSTVVYVQWEPIFFEIHDIPRLNSAWYGKWPGTVRPKLEWEYIDIK